jgi:transcriptional regulator with XRE-family HTH domain
MRHSTPFPSETFKQAGISASDLAALMGVSRMTAHNWLKGGGVHAHLRARVVDLAKAVTAATQQGHLPLKQKALPGPPRHAAIRRAIEASTAQ